MLPRLFALLVVLLASPVRAETLAEHVRRFPQVNEAVAMDTARGELVYPDWFFGTWQVSTTLVDLAAPLGDGVINRRAFAASRALKGKPVRFRARFVRNRFGEVVADLAFNARSISEAYLGKAVIDVVVRPEDVNRQVLKLRGGREGELVTLRRRTEGSGADRFDAAEFYQQTFTGERVPTLRAIETTTLYTRRPTGTFTADQMTAVFLDPGIRTTSRRAVVRSPSTATDWSLRPCVQGAEVGLFDGGGDHLAVGHFEDVTVGVAQECPVAHRRLGIGRPQ